MPDLSPAPIRSRLIQWIPVGGTTGTDSTGPTDLTAFRNVNQTTRINAGAGETWADLVTKAAVTTPRALGATRFLYHNPYGSSPLLVKRYTPVPADGVMHWHQYALAVAAGFTWLTTGLDTALADHTARGEDTTVYLGRLMPKDATTGPPWNWPESVSDLTFQALEAGMANMADLDYIRAQIAQPLAGGVGGICCDTSGQDREGGEGEPSDTALTVYPMLTAAGAHTAAGYSGTFNNDWPRRVYAEAVPLLPNAAWMIGRYSFIALYPRIEESIGDPTRMQISDCAYPPIWLFNEAARTSAGDTLAQMYAKLLQRLTEGRTCACQLDVLNAAGFDTDALVRAAAIAAGGDAGIEGTASLGGRCAVIGGMNDPQDSTPRRNRAPALLGGWGARTTCVAGRPMTRGAKPPALRFMLSPGEAGVAECLAAMAEIVRQVTVLGTPGTGRAVLHKAKALSQLAHLSGQLYPKVVYTFLRDRLEFTRDPPFIELVRHPDELLATIAAKGKAQCDCDEVATLGAALLWARGIEPVFLCAGRPRDLDTRGRVKLSHVFYGAKVGGQIIPFDPQERIAPGTWPPPAAIGRMERYDIIAEKISAA